MDRITKLFQTERTFTSPRPFWVAALGVAIVAIFSAAATMSGTSSHGFRVTDECEELRPKPRACCRFGCDGGAQKCADLEAEAEGELDAKFVKVRLKGGATFYCYEPEGGEEGGGGGAT